MEREPGFFDYEGRFMRFCQEFASLVLTNILFILCCVPVITLGPALLALTSVSLQHWREGRRSGVLRIFWQAFCRNLKQGCILSLLLIAVGGTLLLDLLWLSGATGSGNAVLLGVMIAVSVLLGMILVYLLPLLSMGRHSLWESTCEAFQLCFLNWRRALAIVTAVAAAAAMCLAVPVLLLAVLPFVLLIGFSVPAYIFCMLLGHTLPEE